MNGDKADTRVLTVLVADPDELMIELLEATLANHERCRVITARDGREALNVARRERPALVCLEAVLGGLNGYELCRALRADSATAHARLVVITTLTADESRHHAREAGADYYLTKPFRPSAVLGIVDGLLDN